MLKKLLLIALLLSANAAWAIGEDDPLWNKSTYQKKLFAVGQKILAANHITEKISFQYKNTNDIICESLDTDASVYVSKGMLDYLESDDELAAALGHEIAHIMMRHGTKEVLKEISYQRRHQVIIAPLILGATILGGEAGGNAVMAINKERHEREKLAQRRQDEAQSDELGLQYMVTAGYNPHAFETMALKILADGSRSSVFRDHPMGRDRLQHISDLIAYKYSTPAQPTPVQTVAQPTTTQETKPQTASATTSTEAVVLLHAKDSASASEQPNASTQPVIPASLKPYIVDDATNNARNGTP